MSKRRGGQRNSPPLVRGKPLGDPVVLHLDLTRAQQTYLLWLVNADLKKGSFAPKFEKGVVRDLLLKLMSGKISGEVTC